MYISKLKIFGFKSFAQKVEINFPGTGLTAIVGPNGCGKSNIVDAIRWVMGEQRAKQLRSSKMEDVIFAGTKDRQRLNMAEVSLVVNNSLGLLNSEFAEIQITRRAYRDKGSEYLINNEKCTLGAINSLFYDTGMGASSYSLMEQGVIDAILKNPEERRNVLEEAAGINKYKQERKKALRQLEKTEIDLERVEERIRAFQKNLRRFEKQAEKANKFRDLQKQWKALDISSSFDKYSDFIDNFGLFEKQWKELNIKRDSLSTRLSEVEAMLQERKLAMSNEEENFRELERIVVEKNMDINDLNNNIKISDDRKSHIALQIEQWSEEIENARSDIAQNNESQFELNEEQNTLQETLSSAEEHLNSLNEQRDEIKVRFESAREDVRELDAKRSKASNDYMRLRDEYSKGNQELIRNEDRKESLLLNKKELIADLDNCKKVLEEVEVNSGESNEEVLQERLETLNNQYEELQEQLSEINKSERDLDGQRIALSSRKDFLERMIASGEGTSDGTKTILDNKKDLVKGILADFINVDNQYLEYIETAMGAAMQAVLLKPGENSADLFNYLDENGKGNAIIALPDMDFSTDYRPQIEHNDFLGWASDFVSVDESNSQYQGVVKSLLSSYALVGNYQSAIDLAKQNSGRNINFITPGKRCISSSGLIRGGSGKSGTSGILNRAAELEKLKESLNQLEIQLEKIQSQKNDFQERIDELKIQLNETREDLNEQRQIAKDNYSKKQVALSNVQNREQRLERLINDLDQVESNLLRLREQAGDDKTKVIEEAEKLKNEIEEQYQTQSEALRNIEGQNEDIREQCMAYERSVNADRQRQVQIVQQLENMQQRSESLENLIENRQMQINNVSEEKTSADAAREEFARKIELENEALDVLKGRRDDAKEIYDEKMSALEQYSSEISELNKTIRATADEAHDIELKMQTQSANAKNIKSGIWDRWEIDLDDGAEALPLIEYDLNTANAQLRDLRSEIKSLGNVNLEAIENFEEEKSLMEDDETQFNDLDRARISLKNTINNLDEIAKKRFEETFEIIKGHFQDVFSSITNGGEAHLHLVKSEDDSDPLSDKVMVNAALPGKTMKGIDALSGGEKALTAVSLLFSLYLVKPSPYCILDEVDAPLDDANVNRFVELLRRFARNTQFIVVTHNKHTMSGSDRLYGVTQEEKGISNIASVQLEEAIEIVN